MEVLNLPGACLALDWGQKKIGWATGDAMQIATTVHPVYFRKDSSEKWGLSRSDKDWLTKIIEEWDPKNIILGLPLSLDGSENDESRGARALRTQINEYSQLQVILINEALSTWEKKGQKDEDSQVAAILLKDYWDQETRNKGS